MTQSTPAKLLQRPGVAPRNATTAGLGGRSGALPLNRIGPILVRRPAEPMIDAESRRTKIWELAPTLHCSIIGTCLTTGDLRALVRKFTVAPGDNPTDHDLHSVAVAAVGKHDLLAKQFNKALDRRHKAVINEFGRVRDAEALRGLWDDAVQRGDIPGAYWAILTHPSVSEALIKRVFGDVHMLSHLVGAANRADIRRLKVLEEEKARLEEKVMLQQRRLDEAIASREAKIRDLNAALSARLMNEAAAPAQTTDGAAVETLSRLATDLRRQLDAEAARSERFEQRLNEAMAARNREQLARIEADDKLSRLQDELETLEARLTSWLDDKGHADALDLAGATILYVGGLTHHIMRLRALVERASGHFLHHDGGIEEKTDLLAGLVSRADAAFFPVDCISHEAARLVKRLCRQTNKPFVPLRSSGLSSLLYALQTSRPVLRPA